MLYINIYKQEQTDTHMENLKNIPQNVKDEAFRLAEEMRSNGFYSHYRRLRIDHEPSDYIISVTISGLYLYINPDPSVSLDDSECFMLQ